MKQLTTKKSKQKSLTDKEKYTKINILLNQKINDEKADLYMEI